MKILTTLGLTFCVLALSQNADAGRRSYRGHDSRQHYSHGQHSSHAYNHGRSHSRSHGRGHQFGYNRAFRRGYSRGYVNSYRPARSYRGYFGDSGYGYGGCGY